MNKWIIFTLGAAFSLVGLFLLVTLVTSHSYFVEVGNGNPSIILDFSLPDAVKAKLLTFSNCVSLVDEGSFDSPDGTITGTIIVLKESCPALPRVKTNLENLNTMRNNCYFNYIDAGNTINSTAPLVKCGSVNRQWSCVLATPQDCFGG